MSIFSSIKELNIECEELTNKKDKLINDIANLNIQKLNINKEIEDLNIQKLNIKADIDNATLQKDSLFKELSILQIQKENAYDMLINNENFFVETELKYIDSLNGLQFEEYTSNLLQKLGYNSRVTKASGDSGADVLAQKDNISYIIQCKHYIEPVGNKAIQEIYTAKGIYEQQNHIDKAIVLTTNYFTKQAQKEAKILEVELWNRDKLLALLFQAYNFDINHIKKQNNSSLSKTDNEINAENLLKQAILYTLEEEQISVSKLQRKLKISFSLAGDLIDSMYSLGIISGFEGSKPRKVIASKEKIKQITEQLNLF